jgi:hypothetical protein
LDAARSPADGNTLFGADIAPELIDELCKNYASPDRAFIVSDIVSDPLPEAATE